MSKKYNAPANPVPSQNFAGLTKLEAFTMAAMQGLCANTDWTDNTDVGNLSVAIAKTTLDALEKPEGGENDKA